MKWIEYINTEYLRLFVKENNDLIELIKQWFIDVKADGWEVIDGYPGHLIRFQGFCFFEIQKLKVKGITSERSGWYDESVVGRNLNDTLKKFSIEAHSPKFFDDLATVMNNIEYWRLSPIGIEWRVRGRRGTYYAKQGKWYDAN